MIFSFAQKLIADDSEVSSDEDVAIDDDVILFKLQKGDKPVRINGYTEHVLSNITAQQFQMHFRIPYEAFDYLLEELTPILQNNRKPSPPSVPVNVQLLSTIWLLATPDSYRSVSEKFDLSKSTLSVCFIRIIKALCEIAGNHIKWPERNKFNLLKRKLMNVSRIPHAIGAIDGCFIAIKAPKEHAGCYINRKCFHAVTLQAICDPFFKIHRLFCRIPKFCNKAYPSLPWLLVPYINRGNLTRQQMKISPSEVLGHESHRLGSDGSATVIAACVMHNICITFNDSYIEQYINEEPPLDQNEEEIYNNNGEINPRINPVIDLARDALAGRLWNERMNE
ncbi:hypothetical protein NQ315_013392 [Exocentrus adspersus]|uniref:Nuclease HARBI1 n=1 Tax=Exocentrus adspersus TaxID=1586481 RepID=A0AAV8VR76_9CUCU|nr:hypothetical protein NQ315_013392 [Exocentrus adspersus]